MIYVYIKSLVVLLIALEEEFGTIILCVFETHAAKLFLFLCSLRLALLNEAKEVRAAGLRALRYLIQDSSILQKVLKLKVDYLIAR